MAMQRDGVFAIRRAGLRTVVAAVVVLAVGAGLLPGPGTNASAQSSPASASAATAAVPGPEQRLPLPRPAVAGDPDISGASPQGTDVFVLRLDRKIYHSGRDCRTCAWSEWKPLADGEFASGPAVAANRDKRLQVFAVGADGSMMTAAETGKYTNQFSNWQSLGGSLISQPAAVRINVDGRLEVFAVGTDHGLYHNAQTSAGSGTWTGWQGLSGYLIAGPAVIDNWGGQLEVYAVGSDNALYRNRQTCALPLPQNCNSWSGWQGLGGSLAAAPPEVVRNPQGSIEMVALGVDRLVHHNRQTCGPQVGVCDSWTGWSDLPAGALISQPTAVVQNAMLSVFAVGTDNRVYRSRQTSFQSSTWTGWQVLPGDGVTSPPAGLNSGIAELNLPRMNVFAARGDDLVYGSSQTSDFGDTFSDWTDLGVDGCAPYVWTGQKTFQPGESYTGCKGDKYVFQTDGDFVYYDQAGQLAWQTNTASDSPGRMVFNGGPGGDGDLEIFNADNQKLWEAGANAPGGRLEFSYDGLLAVYDGQGNPAWVEAQAWLKKEIETWKRQKDQLVDEQAKKGCPPLPAGTPGCVTSEEFEALFLKINQTIENLENLSPEKPCTTAKDLGEGVAGAVATIVAAKAKLPKWAEETLKAIGITVSGNALFKIIQKCWDKWMFFFGNQDIDWSMWQVGALGPGGVRQPIGWIYQPYWAPEVVIIDLIDKTRTETDLNIIFEGDANYVPYFGGGGGDNPIHWDWFGHAFDYDLI